MKRVARRLMAIIGAGFLGGAVATASAQAQPAFTLAGQRVTMLIGFATGGGTDAAGRVLAPYLEKHLPGQPNIIVRNMPGASGITAMNHLVQQTAPDGLVFTMGTNGQVDPVNYRKPQSHYDPGKFVYFGGIGRGGYALVIRSEAAARLMDKSAKPVVMGSIGGWPRPAMQVTVWGIEFLGWNARWVTGYQGTNDLMLALERGEVDMTSTGNMFQLGKLVESGKFRIVNQSGSLQNGKFVGRPDLGSAPVFFDQMGGKTTDALTQKAFDYWIAITNTDKILALVKGTPDPIVETYRAAFRKAVADPDFIAKAQSISEDFAPMAHTDVELLIKTLEATPQEVLDYLAKLFAKQGLVSGN